MHEQIFLLFAKKWLTDRPKERRSRQYVNPKRSNSQFEVLVNKCNQWNVGDVCKKNCQHQLQIQTIWISIACFNDGVSLQCICSRILKHIISKNNVSKKNSWPCPPKQGSHSVHRNMNATLCNCECWLRVTWGPDPDWDLLTCVWASTDIHGHNLYPLTSCCVQNHLWAPCVRSGPFLDRSNARNELLQGKNKVIGI